MFVIFLLCQLYILKGSVGEGGDRKEYTFYEVLNFCDMLQNGNPNMTELVVCHTPLFATYPIYHSLSSFSLFSPRLLLFAFLRSFLIYLAMLGKCWFKTKMYF